jgi:hypothetical protein
VRPGPRVLCCEIRPFGHRDDTDADFFAGILIDV